MPDHDVRTRVEVEPPEARPRRRWPLVAGALALAAAAFAALPDGGREVAPAAQAMPMTLCGPSDADLARFAIFRREETARDVLPQVDLGGIEGIPNRRRVRLARRVAGHAIYVAPGRTSACTNGDGMDVVCLIAVRGRDGTRNTCASTSDEVIRLRAGRLHVRLTRDRLQVRRR